MPIYEYLCAGCGREEEILVRSREERDRECGSCGRPMHRKVSMPGTVIFSGTGYYTTDYKRKEGGASGKSGNGPSPSDAGKPAETAKPAESGTNPPAPAAPSSSSSPAPAAKSDPVPAPAAERKRA